MGNTSWPARQSNLRYPTRPRSTIPVSASRYRYCGVRTHAWIGDPLYIEGEYHNDPASREDSACVVEPGTPEDVGKIVRSFTR